MASDLQFYKEPVKIKLVDLGVPFKN